METDLQRIRGKRTKICERAQGLGSGGRMLAPQHTDEPRNCLLLPGLLEPGQHHVGGVTLPAVRGVQRGTELSRVERGKVGPLVELRPARKDLVDPPAVVTGAQAAVGNHFLLEFVVDPFGVFDDEPIHIRHVHRAVRSGANGGGTEPGIGTAEKLAPCLVARALGFHKDSVPGDLLPMHAVVHGTGEVDRGSDVTVEQTVAIEGISTG